jgi:predicted ATP-dependent Lon-type protease
MSVIGPRDTGLSSVYDRGVNGILEQVYISSGQVPVQPGFHLMIIRQLGRAF